MKKFSVKQKYSASIEVSKGNSIRSIAKKYGMSTKTLSEFLNSDFKVLNPHRYYNFRMQESHKYQLTNLYKGTSHYLDGMTIQKSAIKSNVSRELLSKFIKIYLKHLNKELYDLCLERMSKTKIVSYKHQLSACELVLETCNISKAASMSGISRNSLSRFINQKLRNIYLALYNEIISLVKRRH